MGDRGKEETMTIVDFIDVAREQRREAPLGEGGQRWLRSLAGQEARYIREQEEASIEAEDFYGQAEEACDMDPIG
jgi:hypothetical protein